MKRNRHTTSFSVLATGLALCGVSSAAAQGAVIPPSQAQGLFSNFPVGITISDSGSNQPVLIRAAGTESGRPVEWTAARFSAATLDHPSYSMSALTGHWAPSTITVPIFGGISTGGDRMPAVDEDGHLIMTTDNWYSVSVTVDANAQGETGSMLATYLTAGSRDPSGDIFTYYTLGSTAIHPELPHTVRLESSREQLQLADVTPSVANRSITNFDYGMGIISIDPEDRAGPIFTVRNSFYFSVTQAWVNAALANPSYTLAGSPPNASTVYSMSWTGSSWSAPAVAFSHEDLFGTFTEPLGPVEIDALTVDEREGGTTNPRRVVFSLTPASDGAVVFDQILVHQRWPSAVCPTTALKTDDPIAGPMNVSTQMGLRPKGVTPGNPTGLPDNPTGLCGIDPKEPYVIGPVVGLATDQNTASAGTLGLTAVRSSTPSDPVGEDVLHVQIAGVDFAPYELGFVVLYTDDAPPAQPQEWSQPILIEPKHIERGALDLALPIPEAVAGTTFRFRARIYGLNLSIFSWAELRESWVIAVKI
jgi:hypothetical protein